MISSTLRSSARLGAISGLVTALVVGVLAIAAPAQAGKVKPEFFGMHSRTITGGTLPGVEIGAIRLWDSGVSWRQIETSDNNFTFSTLDRIVNNARAAGVRPLIVLGQTPQFHAEKPNAPGPYGAGATSMPDKAAWKRYVTTLGERYGTTVDYQVWNEPNVDSYWIGSVRQMAKLTQLANQSLNKAVGPRATLLAPSFPVRLTYQKRWYKKYWQTKVGGKSVASFVDVVAVNPYPLAKQAPEASMALVRFAKSALPAAARRKPMWNTEINYGLNSGNDALAPAKQISEGKQAAYVARTLVLNATSPIRRTYWYRWSVGPIANTHLVESDDATLTRAGRAWGEVRNWILKTNAKSCNVGRSGRTKGVYTCTFRKSRTEVRRVYWKPSGTSVQITTPSSTRSWTNLAGNTTLRSGKFNLKVGKTPLLVTSRR